MLRQLLGVCLCACVVGVFWWCCCCCHLCMARMLMRVVWPAPQGTKQIKTSGGNVGTYEGEMVSGVAQGRGTWTNSRGNWRYEGEWASDAPRGRGVSYYPLGRKCYEGEWAGWADMRGKAYDDKEGAVGEAGELRYGSWSADKK